MGESDPEHTIEWGESGLPSLMGIDRELLSQHRLDNRLLAMASEEGEDTVEEQRRETDQRAHEERDPARDLGHERA
jgi:hypothetical protein